MVLFRSIHLKGTTVVIATHSRGILEEADKRVISLHHGRIGEPGE
jgi:ABC-type ATPase involved in cell division